MTLARITLGLSVAIWLPYGLFCIVQPGYLGEAAGLQAATATATTEIRAMYGGLQAAIGVLALVGLLRDEFRRPALVTLVFLVAGLALVRSVGAFVDASFTTYTVGAILFEITTVVLAALSLRREPVPA